MTNKYYVTNFYRFTELASPRDVKSELIQFAQTLGLTGLVIVAPEGLNGTVATTSMADRQLVESWLTTRFSMLATDFKQSQAERPMFRQFKVKIRPEIVTIHHPELIPQDNDPSYLSPKEWHQWLNGERKFNLVDARNDYEFRIGHFKGAIDSATEQFTEFPDAVEKVLNIPKDEPLLMYCTGGIRCEKAALEMRRRGYKEVYQLHGGILKFFEEFPHTDFEGECFVFDNRVAVTQDLNPTAKYKLCPHCGDPADQPIACERCGKEKSICKRCAGHDVEGKTCSHECAHHYRLKPWQKSQHHPEFRLTK